MRVSTLINTLTFVASVTVLISRSVQDERQRDHLVGTAKSDEASQTRAREALEELCRVYWFPLYAFVRGRGYSAADAQDLTQSFFAQIIETGGFESVDRERGRFRSYLLGAMKHFLANEWHRAKTQKRGGRVRFIEWDALDPEGRYVGAAKASTGAFMLTGIL